MKNQNRLLSTPFVGQLFNIKNARYMRVFKAGSDSHFTYYKTDGNKLTEIVTKETIIENGGLLITKDGSGGGVANITAYLKPQSKIIVPARKRASGGTLNLVLVFLPHTYTDILEVSVNTLILDKVDSVGSSADVDNGAFKNIRVITNEKQYTCSEVIIKKDYIFDEFKYLEEFINSLPATGTLRMDSSFETYGRTRELFMAHGWSVEQPVAEVEEPMQENIQ